MKRVLRTICLMILLFSLTGCESGCTDPYIVNVEFHNYSQSAIDASVMFKSSGAQHVFIPAGGHYTFQIEDWEYSAGASPAKAWLDYALAKQSELENSMARVSIDSQEYKTLFAELQDIKAKIKHFNAEYETSHKYCQGVANPGGSIPAAGTSSVTVNDGSESGSIVITCGQHY